jgi:hypothetical protein
MAIAVSDNHNCAEAEAPSTFDNLCHTIYMDNPVLQFKFSWVNALLFDQQKPPLKG